MSSPFLLQQGHSNRSWLKAAAAFLLLWLLYQASEALQTRYAPGQPLGPALMLLALLAAWPLGRWLGSPGYGSYALSRTPGWAWVLAMGLVAAVFAKCASLGAGRMLGVFAQISQPAAVLAPLLVLTAAVTTFVPSVMEDILTRGFLLGALPARPRAVTFVLLSALLYTANHVWRFDWGWTEQLRLFCLGLAYAAAAWRWQTLWAAVALHWGWNFGSVLADAALPMEVLDVDRARLLSALAHLALLGVILMPVMRGWPRAPARSG
jgi:membrane protease YdiL (CAAX protease family)